MSNDPHKEALKGAWKEREKKKLVDSIPMPIETLRELFDYLDREDAPLCDHSLRETKEFLVRKGIEPSRVVPWLHEYGGFCDCEVIYNVDDKFGELVGR